LLLGLLPGGAAMITYARLRPGRGFVPGRAAAYYAQRCVTQATVRRCIAEVLAAGVRSRHSTLATAREPDLQDTLSDLNRDGIALLPDLFSKPELDDVVAFFLNRPVVTPTGGSLPLGGLSEGATVASYDLATIVACPGLLAAINRPDILRLASAFLGCRPTLCSVGLRWSFPSSEPRHDTQLFHRDTEDWRFLKMFVYLTDVDSDGGPHIYVAGSHKTSGTMRATTFGQEQLEIQYGKRNLRTVLGARGTTFIADTSGIHAGMPPRQGPRLLLQAQFSILPCFAFRYRPVVYSGQRPLDPYVNRLIIAEQAN
jgi:hypothetical protein